MGGCLTFCRSGHRDVRKCVVRILSKSSCILNARLVLAHPTCNQSKSATLAARPHLERWLERLVRKAHDLAEIGVLAGMANETGTAMRVAAWGYGAASSTGGRAWLAAANYEPVTASYLNLLRM